MYVMKGARVLLTCHYFNFITCRQHGRETYVFCFNGDTLLKLALERVAEESDCKVLGRSQHAVPDNVKVFGSFVVWQVRGKRTATRSGRQG